MRGQTSVNRNNNNKGSVKTAKTGIKPSRKTLRKVKFGEDTYCVFQKEDVPKENIWYSGEEYRAIHEKIHSQLKEASMCWSKSRYHDFHFRGLEHHWDSFHNAKRQRRQRFVHYFLHFNKIVGVRCPEELRNVAISCTGRDQVRAYQIAAYYDANEAYHVHFPAPSWAEEDEDFEHEFANIPRAKNLHTKPRLVVARPA